MAMFRTLFLCFSLSFIGAGFAYANDEAGHEPVASQGAPFDFSKIPLPTIYAEPKAPTPQPGDSKRTCVALDDEIVTLLPLTYRTVPDFYDDPKVAAAIWLTTTGVTLFDFFPDNFPLTEIPLGYATLAFPEYKKYKEKERIRKASFRIESLRRTKARMRCFET